MEDTMRIRGILRNAIAAISILAALTAVYIGCDRQNGTDVISSEASRENTRDLTPAEADPDQIPVLNPLLTPYSTANAGDFQQMLERGDIEYVVDKFNGLEYAVDLPNSFVMEGTAIPEGTADSIDVKIVNVIMRYLPDSANSFIWLGLVESPDLPENSSYITATVLSFVVPAVDYSSYERMEVGPDENGQMRYVWLKDYVLPFESKGNDNSLAAWSWKSWITCTALATLAGCAGSAVTCILSGPGWAGCTGARCAGKFVQSSIGCAIAQYVM
jgi:hypothetical protein